MRGGGSSGVAEKSGFEASASNNSACVSSATVIVPGAGFDTVIEHAPIVAHPLGSEHVPSVAVWSQTSCGATVVAEVVMGGIPAVLCRAEVWRARALCDWQSVPACNNESCRTRMLAMLAATR